MSWLGSGSNGIIEETTTADKLSGVDGRQEQGRLPRCFRVAGDLVISYTGWGWIVENRQCKCTAPGLDLKLSSVSCKPFPTLALALFRL